MTDLYITALRERIEQRRDAMVADLVTYASLETPSDDVDLLARRPGWIEALLGRTAGPPADRRVRVVEGYGDTVALDFPSPTGSAEWVSALCHYDTVWSEGTLAEWPVTIEGDRMTGPGVFDMKSGLIQLGHAIAVSDAAGAAPARRPAAAQRRRGDRQPRVPPLHRGRGLPWRRGARLRVRRRGRRQDRPQGRRHLRGRGLRGRGARRSATRARARAPSTRWPGSSCSCTAPPTSTPAPRSTSASCRAAPAPTCAPATPARWSTSASRRRTRPRGSRPLFAALAPHDPVARVEVAGGWNRPPMERSAATGRALRARRRRGRLDLGFELREVSVGGASDGNFAAALGCAVLDGVGGVGGGRPRPPRVDQPRRHGRAHRVRLGAVRRAGVGSRRARGQRDRIVTGQAAPSSSGRTVRLLVLATVGAGTRTDGRTAPQTTAGGTP